MTTDVLEVDSALEDNDDEGSTEDELIARLEIGLEEDAADIVLALIADEETTRSDEGVAGVGESSPPLPPQEANRTTVNMKDSKVTALRRVFIINKFIMVAITINLRMDYKDISLKYQYDEYLTHSLA